MSAESGSLVADLIASRGDEQTCRARLEATHNREHAALLRTYEARDVEAVYAQTRSHLGNTRDAVVGYVNQWLAAKSQLPRRSG
jgi:DNA-binding GntR family transcriptional regulator